jgi:GDPmannose 4,6-dehydratase
MWRVLQQDAPDDFVLATGEMHTVREFCELAFAAVGVTLAWRGAAEAEQGVDAATGTVRVAIDPAYFRPAEVEELQGDATKALALRCSLST